MQSRQLSLSSPYSSKFSQNLLKGYFLQEYWTAMVLIEIEAEETGGVIPPLSFSPPPSLHHPQAGIPSIKSIL